MAGSNAGSIVRQTCGPLSAGASKQGNFRTSPPSCFNNLDQARVKQILDTRADMPSLQPALLSQFSVDANNERLLIRNHQIDMLPCNPEPIPEGYREAGCTQGKSGSLDEPFEGDRPPDKRNLGFLAATRTVGPYFLAGLRNGFRRRSR